MDREQLLNTYIANVEQIRANAKRLSLTDNDIEKIFTASFNYLKYKNLKPKPKPTCYKTALKIIATSLFVITLICILLYVHQPTSSIVLRNVQGLIYPGLKFVRFLSMPIISYFPALTRYYDETCLVENPLFFVNNMECWPCENVYSVMNITDLNNSLRESGTPYIIKHNVQPVHFDDLLNLYEEHRNVFNVNANVIKSTNSSINNVQDLVKFVPQKSSSTHLSWRINRMLPARIMRKLFPKPMIMSEWSGQSIERFVLIDEPLAVPYTLPSFECSNVFLIQSSGERLIVLKPTQECQQKCKAISVVLKESYLLSYNWWYWKPISFPVLNSTNASIGYISSYC